MAASKFIEPPGTLQCRTCTDNEAIPHNYSEVPMLPTKYASFFKRFIAHIVDVIIATSAAFIVVVVMGALMAGTGLVAGISLEIFDSSFFYGGPENVIRHLLTGLPIASIVLLIFVHTLLYWFYFAVFESSPRQSTPGKMMLGLFVTDIHGRRITFGRAMGRTLSKILSKMFCFLGYILALLTERSQGLHDLIAGTLVLEAAYAAPSVAPPLATPPGTKVTPDLTSVSVPVEQPLPAPPIEDANEEAQPKPDDILSPPEPETNLTEDKSEEQGLEEDKPEQENK